MLKKITEYEFRTDFINCSKPGLYKLVTQTRGGFIAQSLIDGKGYLQTLGAT